jgi:tRNA(Ile)-lysidine synthase
MAAPLIACSGGPDSLALLIAAAEAGVAGLAVCHVDHGVRTGGAREAAFVRAAALKAGVPRERVRAVRLGPGPATAARRDGRSLEEALREARYRALGRAARALRCEVVWTGHTATDQVETLVLHLLRGAGSGGLGGMKQLSKVGEVVVGRPLLGCSRAAVEADLARRGVTAFTDPSNADVKYLRNQVRLTVVPALRAVQPALEAVLGRVCQNLADDAEALEAAAAGLALPLSGAALLAAPRAVRYRALARQARAAGVALETAHLPALEGLIVRRRGGAGIDLPGGRAIWRKGALFFVKSE